MFRITMLRKKTIASMDKMVKFKAMLYTPKIYNILEKHVFKGSSHEGG